MQELRHFYPALADLDKANGLKILYYNVRIKKPKFFSQFPIFSNMLLDGLYYCSVG